MLIEFATIILYGQLLLTNPAGERTGLVWTPDEVAQGFAWDHEQVAFGIPDHDGDCLVVLDTASPNVPPVADDALWAVAMPFTASGPTMEVGTVMIERQIPIVPGRYQVTFQARPGGFGHAYRLEITLSSSEAPHFAILKQGSLGSATVLQTQAGHV